MRSISVALFGLLGFLLFAPLFHCDVLVAKDRTTLDRLLDELKMAGTETEANALTEQIWRHWFNVEDAQARQLMNQAQLARRAGAFSEALVLLD